MSALENPKHEWFAQERAKGKTADEAYVLAGFAENRGNAARLNANESVQKRIAEIQERAASRTEITVARVIEELWAVATADPNELIQFRRGACRDCWGEPAPDEELEGQAHGGALKRLRKSHPISDENPNPECQTCGGEGVGRPWIADTRKLKGAAKKLYAGVKVTKEGVEVKMHDKVNALVQVGRHLGAFVDRQEVKQTVTLEQLVAASQKAEGDS